ncbi:MAG: transcriptional regulator [Terriglobales bacterium]
MSPAKYEYSGLDRLLHERARLSVLASLAAHPAGLQFNDLKRLCGLTDGNLSRHLTILQRAGLIEIAKDYYRNRPRTICRLTPTGRARFAAYVDQLQQVVADATAATTGRKAALRRAPALPATP